jgi:hypothetical protein
LRTVDSLMQAFLGVVETVRRTQRILEADHSHGMHPTALAVRRAAPACVSGYAA